MLEAEDMTNPALDELSVMTYLSYLKQATRIQKEGAPAPVAAAAPEPEPEPEPVKAPEPEPEPEPVVAANEGGNDGADKSASSGSLPPPWERSDDWRTYEVHLSRCYSGLNLFCWLLRASTSAVAARFGCFSPSPRHLPSIARTRRR